jgi:hypothetical protein
MLLKGADGGMTVAIDNGGRRFSGDAAADRNNTDAY